MLANILTQKQLLEAATPLLPAELSPQIRAYQDALLALNNAIPDVRGVMTTREFWERTSDLIVARMGLYNKLNQLGA